jgi:MFS family permease
MNRKGPFASPWWIVAGCALALATSSGVIMAFTFSLFIEPLAAEFHWSRATISLGFSAAGLSTALAAPVMGRLFDRFGAKRTLLYVVPLYAFCVSLLAAIPPLAIAFVLFFALTGLAGAGHSPIAYVKVVSGWFDSRRGLALGLAMSGVGVGAVVMPQIARLLIDHVGWRVAYAGLGLVILGIGLPAVALLVREPMDRIGDGGASVNAPVVSRPAQGASLREAMRDVHFLKIATFVTLLTLVGNGTIVHAVPLLMSHGYVREAAGYMLGALGVSSLLGRLLCGYVLDRVFAPFVAAGIACLGLAGVLLLWSGAPAPAPVLGLVCLGFSLGAETDVMSYLVSRYFGLRAFGELIGSLYAIFSVSAAVGAPLMGLSFDVTGSYQAALAGFVVALLVAAAMVLRLGPYRFPPPPHS